MSDALHDDKPNVSPVSHCTRRDCFMDILLAGQTGVGRSTLINMITGATAGSTLAARVSNDVRPCPIGTTVHKATLPQANGTTLQCSLWDTRGLDEAVDHPKLMDSAATWLREQGFGLFPRVIRRQSEHDLRNVCQKRVQDGGTSQSRPIVVLMWCIHASKIDVPIHWRHFRKVYVEYCGMRVKPVVVITQMTSDFAADWKERCEGQLKQLGLGIKLDDTKDLLLAMRKFRDTASREYQEDSEILRSLIFRLSGRSWGVSGTFGD